jgi:hypothetical protein
MKLQRRTLAVTGVVLLVGSVMYLSWPVGHIPPYDANLVRLAESDLEGYCAGDTFWKTGGMGSGSQASQCRKRLAKKRSDKPDLRVVQRGFCQAIVANGWQGTVSDCLSIMTSQQLWPTYNGSITNQWNRARPYPLVFGSSKAGSQGSGSRTGGAHGGGARTNNPTHQTPNYP